MKTDKLFYQFFQNQPDILSEWIPEIPPDCQFDYSAPVVKEKEFRHDGVFTPRHADLSIPIVF
ncbi:MAG: DUF2887 domain-containing protein, partial [Methylococcaceae bacterium]